MLMLNDVVKSLECCVRGERSCPADCPLRKDGNLDKQECKDRLIKYSLNTIEELRAEREAIINGQITLQKHIEHLLQTSRDYNT